jgi:hypothetical protein
MRAETAALRNQGRLTLEPFASASIEPDSFVNSGVVSTDPMSDLTIESASFLNDGLLSVGEAGDLSIGRASSPWVNKDSGRITTGPRAALHLLGEWRNEGRIELGMGATLELGGSFRTCDLGEIAHQDGTTLTLSGLLDNRGDTWRIDPAAAEVVLAGTILGGVVSPNGVRPLRFASAVLDGVTLPGDLLVGDGGSVELRGGSRFDGDARLGAAAHLLWAQSTALETGTIHLSGDQSGLSLPFLLPVLPIPRPADRQGRRDRDERHRDRSERARERDP